MNNTTMSQLDLYSPDYTLKGLVAEGYIQQSELDELVVGGATKEAIVQAITEILLADG